MSKHNKTCRVCSKRIVNKADEYHKSKYSKCSNIDKEIKRLMQKCKYFNEKHPE